MLIREVRTGEMVFDRAPVILTTRGIGSCLAMTFFVPRLKMGVMVHAMLAHYQDQGNELRFVDSVFEKVIAELGQNGVEISEVEVSLAGGAAMFGRMSDLVAVGKKNIEMAEKIILEKKMTVRSRWLGGHEGRNMMIDLSSGEVKVEIV